MMKRLAMVWDGEHIPEVLKKAPPGRYRLELVDDGASLTPAQDLGIQAALDQLDAGGGRTLSDVLGELRRRQRG
jgi:hypothetical protein